MKTTSQNWYAANQAYLSASLAVLRCILEQRTQDMAEDDASDTLEEARLALPAPSALDTLCKTLGLSAFERNILLLCAGVELNASFAKLYADAQGDTGHSYPTFSLALAALPNAHWSALTPEAPLRRWRLIEVNTGSSLVFSPLRIDEWALHYLTGAAHLDEHLAGLIDPLRGMASLVPSHHTIAEQVAEAWIRTAGTSIIQLCGTEDLAKRAIASTASVLVEKDLYVLAADLIPTSPSELDMLIRLWQREAALNTCVLLVECDQLDASDNVRANALMRFIERTDGQLIIASRERRSIRHRWVVTFDVQRPGMSEQRAVWQNALGESSSTLDDQIDALISQFSLNTASIYAVSTEARQHVERLWDACRAQTRPRMSDLAQRIEATVTWEDLVLPEGHIQTLHEIEAQVRLRVTVYDTWGFGGKTARGLGISALFAGPSGTGKTLAAEVLATSLRLDLYRIDLSAVVSKYIGETEKNLRRVFDAAEEGGAILLFDEADAIFGERSEVKDSHDRYANIEISYLLQRMESYRGLAILTTNMKNALDPAFLRRIRFVLQFPFPDDTLRMHIWQRIFPPSTPTEGLDVTKLARLNVAGGNIRNIALNAAFLAAEAAEPVQMAHLLQAARSEYTKLEKMLTHGEIGGWV